LGDLGWNWVNIGGRGRGARLKVQAEGCNVSFNPTPIEPQSLKCTPIWDETGMTDAQPYANLGWGREGGGAEIAGSPSSRVIAENGNPG
jgi:hypothetical protein